MTHAKISRNKIEKIVKGKPAIVRIDLRKHPEFIRFLKKRGYFRVLKNLEDRELLKLMKDVD